MSKMKIANVRNNHGDKLVIVDYGWCSKLIEQNNLNWYFDSTDVKGTENGLTGNIVNENPVFIVDTDFKEQAKKNLILHDVETFDIIDYNVETRIVINTVDLRHEISQYEYEFGTTITKKKLKEIIKKLQQHKEVIK